MTRRKPVPTSRVRRDGPTGLAIGVPAAIRDAMSLSPGAGVHWTISPDGRTATLTFHTESPA